MEAARKTAAAAVAEQTVAIERERKGREAALVEAKKAFCIAAAEEVACATFNHSETTNPPTAVQYLKVVYDRLLFRTG